MFSDSSAADTFENILAKGEIANNGQFLFGHSIFNTIKQNTLSFIENFMYVPISFQICQLLIGCTCQHLLLCNQNTSLQQALYKYAISLRKLTAILLSLQP